jgi:hypothetical protein
VSGFIVNDSAGFASPSILPIRPFSPIRCIAISSGHGRVGTRVFDDIFAIYEQGFPHGARTKPFFSSMAKLNHDSPVQKQWGPARYEVVYAVKGNVVVGSAMFLILAAPFHGWQGSPYHAVVIGDYRSVAMHERGQGIAGVLENAALTRAAEFVVQLGYVRDAQSARVRFCNEYSMALRMPFGDLWQDERLVGTNSFARGGKWIKSGFLRLLPNEIVPYYIEPKSIDGSPRCAYYCFNAKIGEDEGFSGPMLADMLLRFGGIRRMYGGDPRRIDRTFEAMYDQVGAVDFLRPVQGDAETLDAFRGLGDYLLVDYPRSRRPHGKLAHQSVGSLIEERFRIPTPTHMSVPERRLSGLTV